MNKNAFRAPVIEPNSRSNNAEQARLLKYKVAGTNIRNECPTDATTSTMYKTNNAIVHSNVGFSEVIKQEVRDAQRSKLTRANFSVGNSPNFYNTNNKLAFVPMRGQVPSLDMRKKAVEANRRTNFISQGDSGFEAPPKRFDYGTVPNKGKADTT